MCDCYSHKCEFCNNGVSIHVADFCVRRETISVICPDCQAADKYNIDKCSKMFIDYLDCRQQINGKLKSGRYKGRPIIFLCTDSKAYGIHIN